MSNSRREFLQNLSITALGVPFIPPISNRNFFSMHTETLNNLKDKQTDASQTTADILIDKLINWKVDVIFGIIGDGINPIIEALRKRKGEIKFITVRHEEAAAFMASGYAKYTGKLGACIATTGPGAVHLLNGLYDAKMENTPVIAITGIINHDLLGTQYTQEVDTVKLFEDLTVYNQLISGPIHAQTVVDLACRTALTTPGVAHVTVATDVQMKPLSEDKHSSKAGNLTGSASFTPRIEVPSEDELQRAAAILNGSSKIMILAGRGALNARSEVEQLAIKLKAPVAKALLGKAVLPDDSPYTTGGIGHLGTMASKQMMDDCDTLLILGSNMPWLEYYPKEGQAKTIQIDHHPKRIGLRHAVDIGLTGDVAATLAALLPKLNVHSNSNFLTLAQTRMKAWRVTLASLEDSHANPIKPQFLAAQISRALNEDAVVAIDTGAHTVFSARHWQIRPGQKLAVCGNLASMAPGLPYAIAAQIAFPGRQCVAMVGDGGFTMLMGELATAVLYRLPVKIIIYKNNSLSMDKFEQEELGNQNYGDSLQPIDFVKIAEACGAEGYRCTKPEEIAPVLKTAFASKSPAVIEVTVDPEANPQAPEKIKV